MMHHNLTFINFKELKIIIESVKSLYFMYGLFTLNKFKYISVNILS